MKQPTQKERNVQHARSEHVVLSDGTEYLGCAPEYYPKLDENGVTIEMLKAEPGVPFTRITLPPSTHV